MKKYLFVLCSHNSGSTLLWHLLKTSPHVAALPGEGQWIEGAQVFMREKPWDPDNHLPWAKIKAEWENVWDLNKPILLEKSPPNLMHAAEMESVFDDSFFMVMVRNPYAFCEGSKRKYLKDWSLSEIANRWVFHTQQQIKNIRTLKNVIYFTYGEFTDNPTRIVKQILDFLPELEWLDTNISMTRNSVYGPLLRPIKNFNAAQIAQLSSSDIYKINQVLQQYPDLMEFFRFKFEEIGFKRNLRRKRNQLSTWYIKNMARHGQRLLRRFNIVKPI